MKREDKVIPAFSRKDVKKAGIILLDDNNTERFWALDVLNNWRACHSYPVNTFQAYLRLKIKTHKFNNFIVVQRIKRTPSIISKLKRFPEMQLSRMHDIGGLRAILHDCDEIYQIVGDFQDSKFKHELVGIYDYIEEPKESGYRGIHLVYKYNNRQAPEFTNLRIEIQLRTYLQHAWATAVETMGTFLDHSFKSSEGPSEWLDFFSKVGSAFAYVEKKPVAICYRDIDRTSLLQEILHAERRLNVKQKLLAFGSSIKVITEQKIKLKYYLIHLKPQRNQMKYKGFHARDFEQATKEYLEIEKELGDQKGEQVVLVSADSFKDLKNAYPNYFLDTHEFNKYLDKLLDFLPKPN